jgi:carboxymethylenebutenolidase
VFQPFGVEKWQSLIQQALDITHSSSSRYPLPYRRSIMDHMQYGLKAIDFNSGEATETGFNRRNFLVTTLASGFALAASPVMAQQVIKTDSKGIVAGAVSIPVADGKIPGYRAMPDKAGQFPTIIVIQEIFGVHEHIQDICRRLAKLGYYAIAPELFAREGDVSKMTDIPTIFKDVVTKVPDAQVMSDIDAAVAFAKASKHANTARLGTIGFCWGGRTVWMYAAHNPAAKAGIAYYGLIEGLKTEGLRPTDPIDIAPALKVPVLGMYAELDTFIKAASVSQMEKAVEQSGSGSQIIVFPAVDHGFNADYRPTYNKAAATYGWKLTLDWLKDHGV